VGTTQNFTLENWLGCDSIVTVNVAPWNTSTGSSTLFACPGGTATFEGVSIPVGTTQNFTLQNWLGCDSIVTVNVAPWNTYTGSTTLFACPGGTATFEGVSIPVGTTQNFTLQNWLGCDSTVSVVVSAFPAVNFALQSYRTCANMPTGSIEPMVSVGVPPFQYSLDNVNFQSSNLFDRLYAGEYQVYMADSNGCVFTQSTTVFTIPPLEVELSNTLLPCESNGVLLEPMIAGGDTSTTVLVWWNGTKSTTALATETGPVWLEATDVCGTVRKEATVEWVDGGQDISIVYVPNVFRPTSNNPENALFRPIFGSGTSLITFRFSVFDRWGNQLFETRNTGEGWDGVLKGQEINPGVQVWYLEADIVFCGRMVHVERKGNVTIIR
jgi:hypothetical protein